MRPDQCGTGRRASLLPGDLAVVEEFQDWLRARHYGEQVARHLVRQATRNAQRQLLPGLGYAVGDMVQVTVPFEWAGIDLEGRVGQVTGVFDYRGLNAERRTPGPDAILTVRILTSRRDPAGRPTWLPGKPGLEPHEVTHLHDGEGAWTKHGRVVSRRNWPKPRTGLGA